MPDELWDRLSTYLRTRLRPDLYDRWFAPLQLHARSGDRLEIAAPDKFHRDFVDDNYREYFERELIPTACGQKLKVAFVVDDAARPRPPAPPPPPPPPAPPAGGPQPSPGRPPAPPPASSRDTRPNPRYTFDTFVVGESNQFAFAAAKAVAQKPGHHYNPLFVHGDSGLGKTHLLHAIAHAVLAKPRDPTLTGGRTEPRVTIVSSETYTNEFVEALSQNRMADFRAKYRGCDALLVDDVQFFSGRDRTADEFFHTFNALHEQGVQIVLSSDRSPKELQGLDNRLCSRFEWGMRVPIAAPEFETRAAILRKKAEVEHLELPETVAALLATHIKSNVRELEGALMRLAAFASLKQEPITENLARDVLSDVIPPPGYRPPIEKIQDAVARHYGLTVAKLVSESRAQRISGPRQVAMFLCRQLAGETYQAIAEKFNRRDHTTVMAAERRVEELAAQDPAVAQALQALTSQLKA